MSEGADANFGTIASHYLSHNVRGDRSIGTVFGIRRETSGNFMIGDTTFSVDENSGVTVRGVMYEGTEGLQAILIKTNVDHSHVTP
jgi:hypothetical protein